MVGPPSDSNVSGRLFLLKNTKVQVVPRADVKKLIFLIVLVVIIAVPLIFPIQKKKKHGNKGKGKDKT